MAASQYYFKTRGQVLGPFDLSQIQQRAKRAQINGRTEISTDGFAWQPAQSFPEIFAAGISPPPVAAPSLPEGGGEESQDWFYMQGGQQLGPVGMTSLLRMIGTGELSQTDQVWKDGMSDWRQIGQVPDLASQSAAIPVGPAQQRGVAAFVGGGLTAFCTSCGQQIPREATMCVHCGVPNKAGGTVVASSSEGKSRNVAALLALFVGGFGIHKFYTGHVLLGVLYIVFCITLIPAEIAFVEAILYLSCKSDEEFMQKYCVG